MEPARRTPFYKVIACEIAMREICHAASRSPALLDLEFMTQGLHDTPDAGWRTLQPRLDAVPAGKYDAILLGYGLCGNLVEGLEAAHTPIVVPRAHDCITFFLGSHARYEEVMGRHPSAYFYTSGWLECLQRRGELSPPGRLTFLPARAGASVSSSNAYAGWVRKYGAERAEYLLNVTQRWTQNYTEGVLIDFDFLQPLNLDLRVTAICEQNGWAFSRIPGDLRLIENWLAGAWNPEEFLVLRPGERLAPEYHGSILCAAAPDGANHLCPQKSCNR